MPMFIDGFDDLIIDLEKLSHAIHVECMACGHEIEIDTSADAVTCTHCGAVIEIRGI